MRDLSYAIGNSCYAKKWSNKTITFDGICKRLKNTIRTAETVEEYPKLPKTERDRIKDKGGFVGGVLKDGRRKRGNVVSRSMLTHDTDHADVDFLDIYGIECRYVSCIYSTHGHTPEAPRLRIITPLTRDVTPEEYVALTRYLAAEWGIEQFDGCSYRPHQLMYWPSTPANGEYIFRDFVDGCEWLDPDEYLAKYPGWRDFSQLPTASKESAAINREMKRQADPLEKTGVVGAFCRSYDVAEAIEQFLPEIYEPSAMEGRWDYIPADSAAGVVVYEDKWVYSHHATDPANGQLLNVFDLVRSHLYGDLDEKASFEAMSEFAMEQSAVKAELLEERRQKTIQAFDNWEDGLERSKNGKLVNNLHNINLIMENDPQLQGIVFNELLDGMEVKGEVPWKRPAGMRFWRDTDDSKLIRYVDAQYGTFSKQNYFTAVTSVADDRSYHPVRDYLDSRPPWDNVPRVETLLVDYFGAEDTPYVRAVTRKTLCAAIQRVKIPGIKFDYMLVLEDNQGTGKTTLLSKLGREWYSDSLSMTDLQDSKTAAEKLQGQWILEISELEGLNKADVNRVKAFISRQDDKYRAAFGRRVTPHPRQCVIFGTVNPDKGYLRDTTGNRRFWPVRLLGNSTKQSWDLTDDEISQIWAEAILLAETEKLYLDKDLERLAQIEQRLSMEEDDREGLVRDYLDALLPENWNEMTIGERKEYLNNYDPENPGGTVQRETVCPYEIWVECFRKHKDDFNNNNQINTIMARIEGWQKSAERVRIPIYGQQRLYRRV